MDPTLPILCDNTSPEHRLNENYYYLYRAAARTCSWA